MSTNHEGFSAIRHRFQKAIHDDAEFYVSSQGVLGEQYIEINPGSYDRPYPTEGAGVGGGSPPRPPLLGRGAARRRPAAPARGCPPNAARAGAGDAGQVAPVPESLLDARDFRVAAPDVTPRRREQGVGDGGFQRWGATGRDPE